MPGVKDTLVLREYTVVDGKIVTHKHQVSKLFVEKTQVDLFDDFKKQNPNVNIGFKLFIQQAPSNIRTIKVIICA